MKIDGIEIYNLYWADEFDYEPVVQAQLRAIDGALINFEQAQPVGQTMTLSGAWITRPTVIALQEKRRVAGSVMTVEMDDGRQYSAIFDRSRPPSMAVELIEGAASNPSDSDIYAITLNLQIISRIS